MKKVFVLLLVCFLLVGCGKNNSNQSTPSNDVTKKDVILTCTKRTSATLDFDTEMTYYFENIKIVKLGVKYSYDLSSYTEEQRKNFAGSNMCETDSIKTMN